MLKRGVRQTTPGLPIQNDSGVRGGALPMDFRFAAGEWITLSPEERINRCRLMAAEAHSLAAVESTRMRPHYLELAKQWTALADEMRDELNRRPT
uniref:Uncharacterized protein n=1 Tax=uncultured bacterium BLR3 TaxID=506521 RepID=C0IN66_9BACT|nr:hypothetical protein AKSOIL_0074 [uncultured bacterium BLR3]